MIQRLQSNLGELRYRGFIATRGDTRLFGQMLAGLLVLWIFFALALAPKTMHLSQGEEQIEVGAPFTVFVSCSRHEEKSRPLDI